MAKRKKPVCRAYKAHCGCVYIWPGNYVRLCVDAGWDRSDDLGATEAYDGAVHEKLPEKEARRLNAQRIKEMGRKP